MLYYEKTDVKQYKRKTSNGDKQFNQLNLGYESKFDKGDEVAIIKFDELENLESKINIKLDELESMKKTVAELKELNNVLTDKVNKLESDKENYINMVNELSVKLNDDNKEYSKEISQLNSVFADKLDSKDKEISHLINAINSLSKDLNTANIELQKEKDLKANIIMKYEGIISDVQTKLFFRLFCTMPKSYKQLHDSEIKEIVEVKKEG